MPRTFIQSFLCVCCDDLGTVACVKIEFSFRLIQPSNPMNSKARRWDLKDVRSKWDGINRHVVQQAWREWGNERKRDEVVWMRSFPLLFFHSYLTSTNWLKRSEWHWQIERTRLEKAFKTCCLLFPMRINASGRLLSSLAWPRQQLELIKCFLSSISACSTYNEGPTRWTSALSSFVRCWSVDQQTKSMICSLIESLQQGEWWSDLLIIAWIEFWSSLKWSLSTLFVITWQYLIRWRVSSKSNRLHCSQLLLSWCIN